MQDEKAGSPMKRSQPQPRYSRSAIRTRDAMFRNTMTTTAESIIGGGQQLVFDARLGYFCLQANSHCRMLLDDPLPTPVTKRQAPNWQCHAREVDLGLTGGSRRMTRTFDGR